jgi:hypothetical protein
MPTLPQHAAKPRPAQTQQQSSKRLHQHERSTNGNGNEPDEKKHKHSSGSNHGERSLNGVVNRTFGKYKIVATYNVLPTLSKESTNKAVNSDQLNNIHKPQCRTVGLDELTDQEWQEGEIHKIFVGISKLSY